MKDSQTSPLLLVLPDKGTPVWARDISIEGNDIGDPEALNSFLARLWAERKQPSH